MKERKGKIGVKKVTASAPKTAAMGSTIADVDHTKTLNLLNPALLSGIEIAMPSGKFCIPIPNANAIAPETVASGTPAATPPNITPTANPSGILCK